MSLLNGLNSIGESIQITDKSPTGIVAITSSDSLSITETVSDSALAMYILLLNGLKVNPIGLSPTGMVVITSSPNITSTFENSKRVSTMKIERIESILIKLLLICPLFNFGYHRLVQKNYICNRF